MQSERFQTEFVTPWNYMKAREESNRKTFSVKSSEPFAPRNTITYFGSNRESEELASRITAYDRLHDVTPYDQWKPRCDRQRKDLIWDGIDRQNKGRKLAVIASHWHGRPNRVQVDFPETKFYRSNKIYDNFYRRNDINVSTDLERSCEVNQAKKM